MDDLTSLRWFRRRRVGFGWRPVSWQGWLITLLAVTAAVVVVVVFRGSAVRIPVGPRPDHRFLGPSRCPRPRPVGASIRSQLARVEDQDGCDRRG
jgi:hypothetical protein